MDLNTLWFVLIAVLYLGFFLLEGFDFGVGILLPFLGRDDTRRRVIINTIGPFWDGNEVWLLTAGGATFAAFPSWYATLFSGFYLPLFLVLLALILRGVAFEFRSKDDRPAWRNFWDWAIFAGSLVPALLFGVAFANLVRGVPIDADMNYVGGFFNLLNPYALLGGLASLSTFTLYGAMFLNLRTTGHLAERAYRTAVRLWGPAVVVQLAFFGATYFATDIVQKLGVNPGPVPFGMVGAILAAGWFIRKRHSGWAFSMTALAIAFSTITTFMILYPQVMVSSVNPEWSLTIYNAASSPYTLRVMTIIALIFVPIVLVYQGWTYWVFRKRVEVTPKALHY
ncbi:MAG: cytochrome d ubiquinol oxidase subunit II [Ardenticatenaceae bacterium]|nr:cytochrome d ubiquinol oxidase subunit II [Ardenticatenaceae bacterium]HBY98369.1 cytochrome d ubiquinol oxidase subunit II [Chloroflexota bacterium]